MATAAAAANDETQASTTANDTNLVIVKCVDCNSFLCSACLLAHQIEQTTLQQPHKLIALFGNGQASSAAAITATSPEINNNNLNSAADLLTMKFAAQTDAASAAGAETKESISMPDQLNAQTTSRLIQIENDINKTFNIYSQMLKERKEYLIKELNTIIQFALVNHSTNVNKQVQMQYQLELKKSNLEKEIQLDYENYTYYNQQCEQLREQLKKLEETAADDEETDSSKKEANKEQAVMLANNVEIVHDMFVKMELDIKSKLTLMKELNNLIQINNQLIVQCKNNNPLMSIEFISNYSAIQTSIRNTFGYIRINQQTSLGRQQSMAASASNMDDKLPEQPSMATDHLITSPVSAYKASNKSNLDTDELDFQPATMGTSNKSINSSSSSNGSSTSKHTTGKQHPLSYLYANFINNNPKLNTFNYLHPSNGSVDDFALKTGNASSSKSLSTNKSTGSLASVLTSGAGPAAAAAVGSCNQFQLNRSKMIYHCKFGEFGINDGQFTEPSGVTINTNNDIIVADTNSHRIQIFDKDGNFKFKFGECGKRDGQLLYPNRVSIVKNTGDIVVTERSPTHQIQIYDKYGHFLRKFGANILQHPRGVCVDYKSRIIVVECKVMRVLIFDLYGNVLNKFNCSKYLEFPNGVCCSNPTNANSNKREEIYISDNRAHCIKVICLLCRCYSTYLFQF